MRVLIDVPTAVAHVASAALDTRSERQAGGTARGVVLGTALATGHLTMPELLEIREWHRRHHEQVREGRATLLAGLYGGAQARSWLNAIEVGVVAAALNPHGEGAMVFLPVPDEVTKAISLDDGEPPAGMHMTLFHLASDATELAPELRATIGAALTEAAARLPAAQVDLSHVERFTQTDEGLEPVAMVSDAPAVYQLRDRLAEVLDGAGVPYSSDHAFRAHVTLGYYPPGDGPEVGPVELRMWTATQVGVTWGLETDLYPLAVEAAPVAPAQVAAVYDQTTRRQKRLSRLSSKVTKIDRDLAIKVRAAAEQALGEAIRKATVKLRQKARTAPQRAALEAAGGLATPAVLAALGLEEQRLIEHSFDILAEQVRVWVAEAMRRRLAAAAVELAADKNLGEVDREWNERSIQGRYAPEIDRRSDLAAATLIAALGWLAIHRLGNAPDRVDGPGEVSGIVPFGLVRGALDVARTGDPATFSSSTLGEEVPTVVMPQRARDSLLEQLIATREPTATTTGEWVHAFYGDPATIFEPHYDLDGVGGPDDEEGPLIGPEDPRLSKDPGDFPYDTYSWWIGDHAGCTCELVETYTVAGQMALAAAFDPDQPRDDQGQWSEDGGGGGGPTPERAAELLEVLDNGAESAAEITDAIRELGAEKITFPGSDQDPVHIYFPNGGEPTVIEWDGEDAYPSTENAYDWVGSQDATAFYPEHEQEWNDNFWSRPEPLFHGTTPENLDSILRDGIEMRSDTRGLSNRYDGPAVYTSTEPEEASYHYDTVVQIDTAAMARDGVRPFVGQEPDVVAYELTTALASHLGLEDYEAEIEGGMSDTTVVVQGAIPAKYLSAEAATAAFNDDQPRDEQGRWTSDAGGTDDHTDPFDTPLSFAGTDADKWGSGPDKMGPTTDHPRYFYHQTKQTNRESIKAAGLEAARTRGAHDRVYLATVDPNPTPRMDTAPSDVWKVDTEGLMLRPDPEAPKVWGIAAMDIDPDRLTLIKSVGQARTATFDPDQPRDDDGKWGDGGGGSSSDDKRGEITVFDKVGDGRAVINVLADGRRVQIPATEVSVFLDRLATWAKDAKDGGQTVPTIDLCDVTVPGTNLFCAESYGIPRQEMPQLGGVAVPGSRAAEAADEEGNVDATPAFLESLTAQGYSFVQANVPAEVLKATQGELDAFKVAGVMRGIESGKVSLTESPIFVSADNYILDGHHRWAGAVGVEYEDGMANGDIRMAVTRIDAPILDLVAFANAFSADYGIAAKGIGAALIRYGRAAALERVIARGRAVTAAFDEDAHPRDDAGRFTEGDSLGKNEHGETVGREGMIYRGFGVSFNSDPRRDELVEAMRSRDWKTVADVVVPKINTDEGGVGTWWVEADVTQQAAFFGGHGSEWSPSVGVLLEADRPDDFNRSSHPQVEAGRDVAIVNVFVRRWDDEEWQALPLTDQQRARTAAFNEDQPRDELGRWTSDGAPGGTDPDRRYTYAGGNPVPPSDFGPRGYRDIAKAAIESGFTYRPLDSSTPTSGKAMGAYPERSEKIPVGDLPDPADHDAVEAYVQDVADRIEAFAAHNADLLDRDRHYYGGWVGDTEDGSMAVWLDVSVVTETMGEALAIGQRENQREGFDLDTGESFPVGGTGEVAAPSLLGWESYGPQTGPILGETHRPQVGRSGSSDDGGGDVRTRRDTVAGRDESRAGPSPRVAALGRVVERGRAHLAAFDPAQPRDGDGQWSDGDGESGPARLAAAADLWAGDMNATDRIQTAAEALLEGKAVVMPGVLPSLTDQYVDHARAMLDAVRTGPESDVELFRGIGIDAQPSEAYKVGDTVEFALGSFTSDGDHAESFASHPQSEDAGPWPVMFRIQPGDAQVADLQPFSPQAAREHEYVTGGIFEVVGTESYTPEALDPWGNPEQDPDFMDPAPVTIIDLVQTHTYDA